MANLDGKFKIRNDKYKVVIWLSSNDSMTDEVLHELRSYVTNGGTVIIPVGSLNAAAAASFSGISVNGNVRVGRAFRFVGDVSHTTEIFDFVDLVVGHQVRQALMRVLRVEQPIRVERR